MIEQSTYFQNAIEHKLNNIFDNMKKNETIKDKIIVRNIEIFNISQNNNLKELELINRSSDLKRNSFIYMSFEIVVNEDIIDYFSTFYINAEGEIENNHIDINEVIFKKDEDYSHNVIIQALNNKVNIYKDIVLKAMSIAIKFFFSFSQGH